jgi:predicted DNA repair protein MutK
VLKKNVKLVTITFLVHGRFGIIVTLDTLTSDLQTRHRPFVIEIVVSRWAVRFLYFSTRDRTSELGPSA